MTRTIYLVRHGIAGEAPNGGSDADRRLTPDGVRKMSRAALGLKRLGVAPDLILSSPLRRAEETAALLAKALAPERAVALYGVLAPGHEPAEIVRGLQAHRGARAVMLVGHEPGIGQLLSHLLTGTSSGLAIEFKKGGVAAIQVEALPPRHAGLLQWLLTPKQLRAIARGG